MRRSLLVFAARPAAYAFREHVPQSASGRAMFQLCTPRGFRTAAATNDMFGSLSKNLGWAVGKLGGKQYVPPWFRPACVVIAGTRFRRISSDDIEDTMRMVRVQLLEADVAVLPRPTMQPDSFVCANIASHDAQTR
jgi:hypothetical protein